MTAAENAFKDRLKANVEKHKPLMDRLAREGDCLACAGTNGGCGKHRDTPQADKEKP